MQSIPVPKEMGKCPSVMEPEDVLGLRDGGLARWELASHRRPA